MKNTLPIVLLLVLGHIVWAQDSLRVVGDDSSKLVKQQQTQELLKKLLQEAQTEVLQEQQEQNANQKTDSEDVGLEIDGLVMNETKSKIGQDFYEMFFTRWHAPSNAKNYSLTISEKGAGAWGSWVLIQVNETVIYQNRLKPNTLEIEEAAQSAISIVYNYLVNYEEYKKQLSGDDLKGSGIF